MQLLHLGHRPRRDGDRHLLTQGALVGDARVRVRGADLVIRGGEVGRQVVHQPQPRVQQLGTDRGEMAVPHIERVQGAVSRVHTFVHRVCGQRCGRPGRPPDATTQHRCSGLQKGVALSQDLVILGSDTSPARLTCHQQVIQEATAFRRITLDQAKVLRGEQHRAQSPQNLTGTRGR